jgi:TolB protein
LRLTTDGDPDVNPAWSPDGRLIAFHLLLRRERASVQVIPALGGPERRLTEVSIPSSSAFGPLLSWSPDGKWLAYAARAGRSVDLFVVPGDGAIQADALAPLRLTNTGMARSPAWSPDGRHLAYLTVQGSAFELWVVDLEETPAGGLQARNPRQLTRDLGLDAASGVSWGR